MISIICLKWGTLYNEEYVNSLYKGIQRNVTIPHEFICFSEDATNVVAPCKSLPELNLTGWWNKMWLFNKELPVKYERILYIDLDTVILNNIDNILLNLTDDFYILRDFYKPTKGWGSGLMSWKAGNENLWEKFISTSHRPGHGDQGFIQAYKKEPVTFWQDAFPNDVISYKVHYLKEQQDGKILCFHGKPRPHEVPSIWQKYGALQKET